MLTRAFLLAGLVALASCASVNAPDSHSGESAPLQTAPSEPVREVPINSLGLCQELGLGYPIDPLRCDTEESTAPDPATQ